MRIQGDLLYWAREGGSAEVAAAYIRSAPTHYARVLLTTVRAYGDAECGGVRRARFLSRRAFSRADDCYRDPSQVTSGFYLLNADSRRLSLSDEHTSPSGASRNLAGVALRHI